MGSAIFVSGAVIHVRKRAFENRLQELANHRRKRLRDPLRMALSFSKSKQDQTQSDRREDQVAAGVVRGRAIHDPVPDQPYDVTSSRRERIRTDEALEPDVNHSLTLPTPDVRPAGNSRIQFDEDVRQPTLRRANNIYRRSNNHPFSNSGVGTHSLAAHPRTSGRLLEDEGDSLQLPTEIIDKNRQHGKHSKIDKYVDTINGYLGRNSQFFSLTEKERRQLGGIEYDALCVLSYVVTLYFVLFQLIGAVGCGAWMQINLSETTLANGAYAH